MTQVTFDAAPGWSFSTKAKLAGVLAIWFAVAAAAGMSGILAAGPDTLMRPVLLSVAIPFAIFLGLYYASSRFRTFVLTRDIRTMTMLQSWRVIGFGFLMLYAWGTLPGVFALPAGIGDFLMGLSAPLVVLALERRPQFVRSWRFVVWNLLGMTDFAIAAGTATLASGAISSLADGAITSAPMEVWPLALFPSFIVPLFAFLHMSVLFQLIEVRRAEKAARR